MRDYITISCTPVDEPCQQVGKNYNRSVALAENRAFMSQLRRQFGDEPEGAIRRINPSAWTEEMYQPRDWDSQYLLAYRNKKIRSSISKEWAKKYKEEIEEIWANMRTSNEFPTTTWD
jgi:hypothetical protein